MTNREYSTSKSLISGLLSILVSTLSVSSLFGQANVLTWHNDAARTGQNLQETILSPSNVNSTNFGLLFAPMATDGKVDAQPLYVPALAIAGGTHNVLYVATENDTVYAFDADSGAQIWSQTVLSAGETASDDRGCSQVTPQIGITSTPVIDLSSGPHGTIYLVAMSKDGSGNYHQRLHALDMFTHTEEFGGPINIQATYPSTGPQSSNGVVTFDPKQYKDRAALLLSNGVIYTSWASHCDADPYSAWIMGYNESSLAQVSVLNLTPNGSKGSIWQAGAGPAADASGELYFLMANGTFDTTLNANGFPSQGDYGNAFMNLSTAGGLAVTDYFTMDNTVSESNSDVDLGSGGAMLLPALNDALGNPRELAVGAGKDGNAYVVDRNNMGKYNGSSNAVYQQFALGGSVFSSPAWFNNTMYYGPVGQQLQAFQYSGGSFGLSSQTSVPNGFVYPGATPSISANGTGNGIVWAVQTGSPAVLYAFDASNLSELYDSTQAANSRDSFGTGITFATPTVANGKVYVGTTNGVGVFGLLGCSYSIATSLTLDSSASSGSVTVTANPSSCTWSAVNNSNFITVTGVTSGSNGRVSFSVPANPGATRTGILVIAGQEFTITQGGANSLAPAPSNPTPANGSTGVAMSTTLSWSATSNASSYDVYFGTSPTPSLVANATSTNYKPGTLTPGITYYWMVVAKNSGGTNSSPVWSFTTTAVTAVSVSPNSGSGASHTFAFVFSDLAGAANIASAQIVINGAFGGTNSCYIAFQTGASNLLYLASNAGAFQSPLPVGSAGTLQNSQCAVNLGASSVSLSGNTLTLNLAMSFTSAFAGAKNIYMLASNATFNSGWVVNGNWTATASAPPAPPAPVSVTPNGQSGASQTFAFTFSDPAGAADIASAQIVINGAFSGTNSCYMAFLAGGSNLLYLASNAGAFQSPLTIGSAGTLQNSQCAVNLGASSVSLSGNTLTLNLAMSFTPAFAGIKSFYTLVSNATLNSGWVVKGTWTVPAASAPPAPPAPVSVTPNGQSGASQTFAFTFSDPAGAADIASAQIVINGAFSGTNSCYMAFLAGGSNVLYLASDAGAFQSPLAVGSAGTLQNSQCAVNLGASSVSLSGNTLTLNLAMSFTPAFAGTKSIYTLVSNATLNSGWVVKGTWTVPAASAPPGPPAPVSVTPNGQSGASQTFAFTFSDPAGAADIASAQIVINGAFSGTNSCYIAFQAGGSNLLYLASDAGAFQSPLAVGSAGTLQNSQCAVNLGASSVSLSGNTLTLNLAMSFTPAFAGTKSIYTLVSNATLNSGWVLNGTWIVP